MYVGQHKHLGFCLHLKGHKILFKRKKLHLKEFLNYSQRVLSEYSQFSAQKKLDTYLTHLGAAIAKLYYIINSVDSSKYPEAEALKLDYLLTDIRLIKYFLPTDLYSYSKYDSAKSLNYPSFKFKVINPKNGTCVSLSDGTNFICTRVAIDYSLNAISNKWLNEIPKIAKLISNTN